MHEVADYGLCVDTSHLERATSGGREGEGGLRLETTWAKY